MAQGSFVDFVKKIVNDNVPDFLYKINEIYECRLKELEKRIDTKIDNKIIPSCICKCNDRCSKFQEKEGCSFTEEKLSKLEKRLDIMQDEINSNKDINIALNKVIDINKDMKDILYKIRCEII